MKREQAFLAQFIGPGTYEANSHSYITVPKKKYDSPQKSRLVKIGKNLLSANRIPPEYEDQN